jgi:hypothetical protein
MARVCNSAESESSFSDNKMEDSTDSSSDSECDKTISLISSEIKKSKRPKSKADFIVARKQKIAHFFVFFVSHGNKLIKLFKDRKHSRSGDTVVVPEVGDAVLEGNEEHFSNSELIHYCKEIVNAAEFDPVSFSKFTSSEAVAEISKKVFGDRSFYENICDEDDLNQIFPVHFQFRTGQPVDSQLTSSDLFNAIEKYKADCRLREAIDVELSAVEVMPFFDAQFRAMAFKSCAH